MDFTYNPNQIALLGEDDKLLAEVTFPEIDKDTVNIDHTFVDPSLRGQNLADKLMNAVAEQLCAEDKKAVLTCSYAVKWFDKHPEYKMIAQSILSDCCQTQNEQLEMRQHLSNCSSCFF